MSRKWIVIIGAIVVLVIVGVACAAPKPMRTPYEQAAVEAKLDADEHVAVHAIAEAATDKRRVVITGDKPVITIPGAVKMLRLKPARLASYELRLYDKSGKRLTASAPNHFGYLIFSKPIKGLTIKSIPDLTPEDTTPTGQVGQVEAWIAS